MPNPRIIVSHERKLIIVNNYKAGFSTFNNALNLNNEIKTENLTSLRDLDDLADYRKVLFFREPFSRFVSYFSDKVILGRGFGSNPDKRVRELGGPKLSEELDLAKNGEHPDISSLAEKYVRAISPIIWMDGHTTPQHLIYTQAEQGLDMFDEVYDFKENIAFLKREFDLDVTYTNQTSSSSIKDQIMTPVVKRFCRVWYSIDLLHYNQIVQRQSASDPQVAESVIAE